LDLQGHIPIYKKLTEYYRKKIITQELKPGNKMDSITRIMSRHKVSRETAKRVLNNLLNEKLVVSQVGRGTFINFQTSIVKTWGMVVPFYTSIIEQLISKVNIEATKTGRKLQYFLHYNNPEEEMRTVGQLIQKGFEAVIIVPNYDESKTGGFYRELSSGNTKIILADNTMAGSYFKYAIQSYDLGVKRAVDYMTKEKVGNYLFLSNERWQGKNLVFDLMKQTFEIILDMKFISSKLFVSANINDLSKEFFEQNNIKGVLTIQDSLAIRMIGRLKKWGFNVPKDINLVCYGNTELTEYYSPAISVIDCKYDLMAECIASLINDEGNNGVDQLVIQPELIIRES